MHVNIITFQKLQGTVSQCGGGGKKTIIYYAGSLRYLTVFVKNPNLKQFLRRMGRGGEGRHLK